MRTLALFPPQVPAGAPAVFCIEPRDAFGNRAAAPGATWSIRVQARACPPTICNEISTAAPQYQASHRPNYKALFPRAFENRVAAPGTTWSIQVHVLYNTTSATAPRLDTQSDRYMHACRAPAPSAHRRCRAANAQPAAAATGHGRLLACIYSPEFHFYQYLYVTWSRASHHNPPTHRRCWRRTPSPPRRRYAPLRSAFWTTGAWK